MMDKRIISSMCVDSLKRDTVNVLKALDFSSIKEEADLRDEFAKKVPYEARTEGPIDALAEIPGCGTEDWSIDAILHPNSSQGIFIPVEFKYHGKGKSDEDFTNGVIVDEQRIAEVISHCSDAALGVSIFVTFDKEEIAIAGKYMSHVITGSLNNGYFVRICVVLATDLPEDKLNINDHRLGNSFYA